MLVNFCDLVGSYYINESWVMFHLIYIILMTVTKHYPPSSYGLEIGWTGLFNLGRPTGLGEATLNSNQKSSLFIGQTTFRALPPVPHKISYHFVIFNFFFMVRISTGTAFTQINLAKASTFFSPYSVQLQNVFWTISSLKRHFCQREQLEILYRNLYYVSL